MTLFATIPQSATTAFQLLRKGQPPEMVKKLRKEMFAAAKRQFGIPKNILLRVEVDGGSELGVMKRKDNHEKFELHEDGLWVGAKRRVVPAAVSPLRFFKLDLNVAVDKVTDCQHWRDGVQIDGADTRTIDGRTLAVKDGVMYVGLNHDQI